MGPIYLWKNKQIKFDTKAGVTGQEDEHVRWNGRGHNIYIRQHKQKQETNNSKKKERKKGRKKERKTATQPGNHLSCRSTRLESPDITQKSRIALDAKK